MRLGDGPIWKKATETEYRFCRNYWWINLLYLNNYIAYDKPCMQHAWFLATDFQLTLFGAIVFTIIWKYPKCVVHLLSSLMVLSVITFFSVVYFFELDTGIRIWPEYMKHILVETLEYSHMYIGIHTNFGAFTIGLIFGYIYYRLRKTEINLKNNKVLTFHVIALRIIV